MRQRAGNIHVTCSRIYRLSSSEKKNRERKSVKEQVDSSSDDGEVALENLKNKGEGELINFSFL